MTDDTGTNITPRHQALFGHLLNSGQDYALFSCFYDGLPAVVIVRVWHERADGDEAGGHYGLHPVWLAIDDAIAARLTDHQHVAPTPGAHQPNPKDPA